MLSEADQLAMQSLAYYGQAGNIVVPDVKALDSTLNSKSHFSLLRTFSRGFL